MTLKETLTTAVKSWPAFDPAMTWFLTSEWERFVEQKQYERLIHTICVFVSKFESHIHIVQECCNFYTVCKVQSLELFPFRI